MHVNQQIREAVKSRIEGIPGLESVFTNRGANLVDAQLPAAVIGTGSDEVELATKPPGAQERRTLALTIVIVAEGENESLDDDLDAIRVEIEKRLGTDQDLGGLAKRVEHTGGELELAQDEDGERWYAFLVLSWEIEVWTTYGDPEAAQ